MFFLRLSSSLQALQNSFPPLLTVKHSSGNSFTRSFALTDFGSLEPWPLDLFWPTGGFESIFLFLVRSDAWGALRTSSSDRGLAIETSGSTKSKKPMLTAVCACAVLHWTLEEPIIQFLQKAAYYSKNYSWIICAGLVRKIVYDQGYCLVLFMFVRGDGVSSDFMTVYCSQ